MKRARAVPVVLTPLDPAAHVPLHRQLYEQLRTTILAGQLRPGARLPATRTLAADLGIARTTVNVAYAQLQAEGYVTGTVGAGTHVAAALPDHLLHVASRRAEGPTQRSRSRERGLSQRGTVLATTPVSTAPDEGTPHAFRPGLPALDAFPLDLWTRLFTRRARQLPAAALAYGAPAGYGPLRAAIAGYLGPGRGVRCTPEQVIVVSGSQQALDLAARVLLDPGEAVWVEDPGYRGARGALAAAGAALVPVPVDDEGLDVAAGIAQCPGARLACVTPSHQYPLSVTMSAARRLALLEWAARADAWIVEDDYDSEYRYAGPPLTALQRLDTQGRVIYMGTFSKVLFPALRLGYLVVPPDLVDAFVSARALSDRHPPTLDQAVLTDFMTDGHFARHIRRMRLLYAERQELLIGMAAQRLEGLLDVQPSPAGMHLLGWTPPGMTDQWAATQASRQGVEAPPLSAYHLTPGGRAGLLLGYTAFDAPAMQRGVDRLARALATRGGRDGGVS